MVLRAPDKDVLYIKRIIGLPGDIIKIENGHVYVNEIMLKEDYLKKDTYTNTPNEGESIVIKDGYYFVLGDNRGASNDSRFLGSISEESLQGKAEFRFFPFDSLRQF